jgi:hypothetical protein
LQVLKWWLRWNTSPILQHIRKHRTFVSDYPRGPRRQIIVTKLTETRIRLFWYWNYRDWRTARGTCRYFIFIRKGKGYYVPFQKNKEEARLIDKHSIFSKMNQLKKIGQNLKYDKKSFLIITLM